MNEFKKGLTCLENTLETCGTDMKTFDTFEEVDDMGACIKRPITVHAKKIDEEFRVNTLEGNYKQGKPGDYLMRGIDGELYICDGPIFERSYDMVKDDNEA